MSKALKLLGGEEATETSNFVEMMDKFFDALNVHNYAHGLHSRKQFQMPYISAKDKRLKVHAISEVVTVAHHISGGEHGGESRGAPAPHF